MKKTLIALFTLVALSIGAQSFAACPCASSSSYGYNMASPCGCPIAKPCCPVAPCVKSCNPCATGYACPYQTSSCNNSCCNNCNSCCNNCCREKCSWWKIFQNKNCCSRCDDCCGGGCGCNNGCDCCN